MNTYKLPIRHNRGVPSDRFSLDGNVEYLFANYISCARYSLELRALVNYMESIKISTQVKEALRDLVWTQVIEEEMLALQKNKTWEIVQLPKGKKLVDCRWVFTIKYKVDGSVDRYQARLVAKRCTETYGVD